MISESSKNANMTIAILNFQHRILKNEKTMKSVKNLLKNKIGEDGILEIVKELDESGIDYSLLLD